MKKIIVYIIAIASIGMSSCEKWLTVLPETQTTADKLFESKQGFSDALIGLYMTLRGNYTPAQFMMGAGIDHMACSYSIGTSAMDYPLYAHDYTHSNADEKLGTAFLNNYKVIANANILLEALETQTILDKNVAAVIEAEARAIRAFAHFDLIRIWGPVPTMPGTKTYLPYVTTKQSDPYNYETYPKYMELVLADLDKAEELLKDIDPLLRYSNSQLNTTVVAAIDELGDLFWYYRQNRFNIYAVQALKARYHLWMGNLPQAASYAKSVVESKNSDGTSKFWMADPTVFTSTLDYTMFEEQIFGLNIVTYQDVNFSGTNPQYSNTAANIAKQLFDPTTDQKDSRFQTFYGIAQANIPTTIMGTLKFSNMRLATNTSSFSIPMIRISEMYLILAEAATLSEANHYYSVYCQGKGISVTALEASTRKEVILKEYLREFYSEGQSFFAYKRNFAPKLLFSEEEMTETAYVPALPSGELNPLQ